MFTGNSNNDDFKEPIVPAKLFINMSLALPQSTTAPAEDTLLECLVDEYYPDPDEMQRKEMDPIDSAILDQTEALLATPDEPDTVESTEQYSDNIGQTQQAILFQHGYQYITKLNNTLQGELFKAKVLPHSSLQSDELFVIIKKTNKRLYSEGISVDPRTNFTYCVGEDALKEASILQYLTADKSAKHAVYIRKFIDIFETKKDYYLVMEHIEDGMNFKEFIEKAHRFIKAKKMEYKHYVSIIKYLFWQLFATMHWLHVDMKCCHLNLMLENIIIRNVKFRISSTGEVKLNPNLSIKLTRFDYAEIFSDELFECNKPSSYFRRAQYEAPQIVDDGIYDPRKADNWALGMMLIHALIGKPLYDNVFEEPIKGSAYSSLINDDDLLIYIYDNGLDEYLDVTVLSLITCLLDLNESTRFNSIEILQHPWFDRYYTRYKKLQRKKTIRKFCRNTIRFILYKKW